MEFINNLNNNYKIILSEDILKLMISINYKQLKIIFKIQLINKAIKLLGNWHNLPEVRLLTNGQRLFYML